jgi:dihydrofolate synthase/folylpolyglutamate synthase
MEADGIHHSLEMSRWQEIAGIIPLARASSRGYNATTMVIEDNYQKTLDYLYSYVDFSLTKGMRYSPEQFDLGRMVTFVQALGNPQNAYLSIHVAGTKGKGSVSALCTAALMEAGYRVGLYTSPHLHDYTERIQVNRQSMPHTDLIDLVEKIKPNIESTPKLTTFEITTALALLYFQRQKVDVSVLEVGLGGRLDATNIVHPSVSVITSLSYDHTQILGDTLAQIAREKAGIIKEGVPVVLAPQKDEALSVIEQIATERSAPLVQVGRDYHYQLMAHSIDGQSLRVWKSADENHVVSLEIPLLGMHQVENAVTAYATLQAFSESGLPVDGNAIRKGFARTSWPGRFEILQRQPPVVVDSAHNRDSALRLRETLDMYYPDIPVIVVFGASEDKDIEGMLVELSPRVQELIAVQSFHPRAIDPGNLVEAAGRYGIPARIIVDIPEALEAGLRIAGEDKLILVTGSIFVVAASREFWMKRSEKIGTQR